MNKTKTIEIIQLIKKEIMKRKECVKVVVRARPLSKKEVY